MALTRPQSDITSYDLVKTFAVICMVIDHTGHYFLPDDNWTRMIGRLCVPIWFFLIGYAHTRHLPFILIAGATFLVLMNAVVGMSLLPLNVLPTMIFIRLLLDKTMAYCLKSSWHLWLTATALLVISLPTYIITEYGTLGLILAMYGYMVRHRDSNVKITKALVQNFMVFTIITFLIMQQATFSFSKIQMTLCGLGIFIICYSLLNFQGKTYPLLTQKLPNFIHSSLHFCGRYTLEIYVVHLTLFKIAALMMGMKGYELFHLKLLPLDL